MYFCLVINQVLGNKVINPSPFLINAGISARTIEFENDSYYFRHLEIDCEARCSPTVVSQNFQATNTGRGTERHGFRNVNFLSVRKVTKSKFGKKNILVLTVVETL